MFLFVLVAYIMSDKVNNKIILPLPIRAPDCFLESIYIYIYILYYIYFCPFRKSKIAFFHMLCVPCYFILPFEIDSEYWCKVGCMSLSEVTDFAVFNSKYFTAMSS